MRKNGSRAPDDQLNGAFQLAFHTDQAYFNWMASRPNVLVDFNAFMEGDRGSRPDWVDWYPVKDQLIHGFKPEDDKAVMLVDVAGGRGHDIALFKKKFPEAPGRLILEDLPQVINDVRDLDPSVERVKHDFFTEQPIKGRSQSFHHISDPVTGFADKLYRQAPAHTT